MSTDRRPVYRVKAVRLHDGRYLRFSHRFATYQVLNRHGVWVNVRAELAAAYHAAGFPVDTSYETQGELT